MKKTGLTLFAVLIMIASSYLFTQTSVISDPNLEQVIRETIGKEDGDITIEELKSITYLNAMDKGISSLEGLQHCENLIMVDLRGNDITDISNLSTLPRVDYLNLSDNSITDVSPLADYTIILTLDLSGNSIEDLSPLSELNSLAYLHLKDNSIEDISPLYGLNLSLLNLEGNAIIDISPLAEMTGLAILNLTDNEISNIEPLSNLRSLTTLYLSDNEIGNITKLGNLKELEKLDLSGNPIYNIRPLSSLSKLIYLNLSSLRLEDISTLSRLTKLRSIVLDGNSIEEITALKRLYEDGAFRSRIGDEYNIVITNNDMDIKPDTINRQIVDELLSNGVSIKWEEGNRIRIIFYDVTGQITDTTGNAIPEAEVKVYDETAGLMETLETDAKGYYTIRLSNGAYTVTAHAPGHDSKTGTINVDEGSITGEDLSLKLTVYQITGKVSDEDDEIVAEAVVTIYDEEGMLVSEVRTDENGEYTVSLTNGEYKVRTRAKGYQTNQSGIVISKGILNKGKIVMQKLVYTVKGQLRGRDGNTVERASISVKDENGNTIYTTQSDENGTYKLELKNGSYSVDVTAKRYKPLTREISVMDGELFGGNMVMDRAEFTLSGRVVDNMDKPIVGAKVTVRDKDGNVVATTQTDTDGRYSVSLPIGEYDVTVEADLFKRLDTTFQIGETGEISGREELVMDYLYGGGITGNIANNEGEPVDDVLITIIASDGNQYTTLTDTDGNYIIPNLPEDEYKIVMEHPNYITANGNITVEDEITVFPQILFLLKSERKIANLEGIIKDAQTGGGLAGIQVTLYKGFNNTSEDEMMSVSSETGGEYDLSIESGYYTLVLSGSNVTDASYNITITGDLTRDFTISAKIESGKVRVILTWGEKPEDLDSHLKIVSGDREGHIYYHIKSLPNGDNLDVDDTESYGPETITFNLDRDSVYTYYVHDYTNREEYGDSSALANSQAKVTVIVGSEGENLTFEYNVPSKEGTVWKVFEIVDGEFNSINKMYYVTEPSKIPLS
jgi:Leucine-rich repeat (LRR) protein